MDVCNESGDDTEVVNKIDEFNSVIDSDTSIDVDALIEEVENILDVVQASVNIEQNAQNIKTAMDITENSIISSIVGLTALRLAFLMGYE